MTLNYRAGPRDRIGWARRPVLYVTGWIVMLAATVVGAQEMQVDGRPVETKADGTCAGLLTTGTQRYADCGNGTVYDTITGLLWLRDAACADLGVAGSDDWLDAQHDTHDLQHGLCGLTDHSQPGDWRLPTREEWLLTIDAAVSLLCISGGAGGPPSLTDDTGVACYGLGAMSSFVGTLATRYWTADSFEPDPGDAHFIDLDVGNTGITDKASIVLGPLGIWPVRRDGGPGTPAPAVVEGGPVETKRRQTCLAGATNLAQRYIDCGDGTVLDLHTDLVWLADASCPDLACSNWPTAIAAAQALASGTCGLSDGSQPGEWRLATLDEWTDTMQRAKDLGCTSTGAGTPPAFTDLTGEDCLAHGATPFTGIENVYWALDAITADFATLALTPGGSGGADSKSSFYCVWPVRRR